MNALLTNPQFQNKELVRATKKINNNILKLQKNLYEVAITLSDIEEKEIYKDDFSSITEYTEKVFGFKKSACYSLLKIGKEFTDRNKLESNLPHEFGHDFSTTQVERMLPLGGREDVLPYVTNGIISADMSCKEIQNKVKEIIKQKKLSETTEESDIIDGEAEETENNIDRVEQLKIEIQLAINALCNETDTEQAVLFVHGVINTILDRQSSKN